MAKNKADCITVKGDVIDSVRDNFTVRLENGATIRAVIGGKLRYHHIRILPGDKVTLEMSTYDLTKGRIIWRDK